MIHDSFEDWLKEKCYEKPNCKRYYPIKIDDNEVEIKKNKCYKHRLQQLRQEDYFNIEQNFLRQNRIRRQQREQI